jgi:hypothetical protein
MLLHLGELAILILKRSALPLAASHRRTALKRQRENRLARLAN